MYLIDRPKMDYRWALNLLNSAGVLVTCAAGAILFVYLFGAVVFEIQGLLVSASVVPSLHGATIVELPPLGSISAATHRGPLQVNLRLEQVETDAILKTLDSKSNHKEILGDMQAWAHRMLWAFVFRQVMMGALGAFVLVFLLWRPRLRVALASGLGGALIIGLVLLGGVMTYNFEAFREPQYEGAIALAPNAVRIAGDSLANLNRLKNQADLVVTNIQSLFTSMDSMAVLGTPIEGEEVIKILVISDLHSNPVGVQLTRTLTQKFDIDFIINAGDLTDFGSSLETQFIDQLRGLGVPQVFVPGNHDTPETMRFMAGLPDTHVLEKQTVELHGIRILGVADPLAYSVNVQEKSTDTTPEKRARAVEALIKAQEPPDILVVHNPQVARYLAAYAPLVITGHTHKHSLTRAGKTIILNPGTTGAAGIRGFYAENGAYSAMIIHFRPGDGPVSVDLIKYEPLSQQFSLERHVTGTNMEQPAITANPSTGQGDGG